MRRALLTAAAALVLAGCSNDHGTTPEAGPTAVPSTSTGTAPTQGPVTGPTVPLGAFVSATDLGEDWTQAAAAALPCRPTVDHKATRSVGLREERGTLTQTIATEVGDIPRAVSAWRTSLQRCGYAVSDDSLGDAGITAVSPDGDQRLLVTGTEGVLIVLHARGDLADAGEELQGWADLALGTSCVAAPDGCH